MSKPAGNLSPEKQFVLDHVERNAKAIALVGDSIFHFAELGMQEFESSKLMTGLLEKAGFEVERGIAGFPTGFCATYGSGSPVIALHTEFDANPDNSQAAGIPEQTPIVEGAPGHCEGHNVNAAVLIGGALAAKAAIDKFGFKGTLKVFGAPAEEQVISRPYFVRDGYFDDVDIAIHDHIGQEFKSGYGLTQSALISATFTFHGETAHAGVAPWKGRDALDGVVLMDMGMAQYRAGRHAALDGGGARLRPQAADRRQGEGQRAAAEGDAARRHVAAALALERLRRRVVEGADGPRRLSVQRAARALSPLGRRRRAGLVDRA
jgi:aminobenzoyl-glutamate utilization protein B